MWGDPPDNRVRVVMACPNRLGVHEPLPPGEGWAEIWWWSDPLCAARSYYRDAPRVRRVTAPVPLPSGRSVTEASERCRQAADYLVRRIRQIRGVHIPSVPHGRRFPVLLPTEPAPLAGGGGRGALGSRTAGGRMARADAVRGRLVADAAKARRPGGGGGKGGERGETAPSWAGASGPGRRRGCKAIRPRGRGERPRPGRRGVSAAPTTRPSPSRRRRPPQEHDG